MPVEGPMARKVADVRLGLHILAGRDRRDPYSVPAPLDSPMPEGRPLRVALLAEPPGGSTDPRVADCARAAADALANAGYEMTEGGPPRYEEALTTWFAFIGEDIRTMAPLITPIMSDDGERVPRRAARLGRAARPRRVHTGAHDASVADARVGDVVCRHGPRAHSHLDPASVPARLGRREPRRRRWS